MLESNNHIKNKPTKFNNENVYNKDESNEREYSLKVEHLEKSDDKRNNKIVKQSKLNDEIVQLRNTFYDHEENNNIKLSNKDCKKGNDILTENN